MVAIVTELHTDEKVDATVGDVGFRETLPPRTSKEGEIAEPPNLERKWLQIRLVIGETT